MRHRPSFSLWNTLLRIGAVLVLALVASPRAYAIQKWAYCSEYDGSDDNHADATTKYVSNVFSFESDTEGWNSREDAAVESAFRAYLEQTFSVHLPHLATCTGPEDPGENTRKNIEKLWRDIGIYPDDRGTRVTKVAWSFSGDLAQLRPKPEGASIQRFSYCYVRNSFDASATEYVSDVFSFPSDNNEQYDSPHFAGIVQSWLRYVADTYSLRPSQLVLGGCAFYPLSNNLQKMLQDGRQGHIDTPSTPRSGVVTVFWAPAP